MSSDFFTFDNFFCDSSSSFTDLLADPDQDHVPYDYSQEIQGNSNVLIDEYNIPVDETSSLDQIAPVLLSSSPTSSQLENSSLSHLENAKCSALEVKTDECQLSFDGFSSYCNSFLSHSFDSAHETAAKFMQKSYRHNQNKQNFSFGPPFDRVLESQNSQNRILSSPESSFSSGERRKVCSIGDLQKEKIIMQTRKSSDPLSTEKSFIEEANLKVRRYSAEERKERIDRYRAKRTQRNFNKTIKYACRKTLADNRVRIRGRFARNDEVGEILKASVIHRCEDEDDLWIDGFHEEDDEGIARIGSFSNSFGSTQYQNYSY